MLTKYNLNVLTNKGIKQSSELYPGDKVYSYINSSTETLEIADVIPIKYQMLYEILYNDGRKQIVGNDDLMYIGNNKSINIKYLFRYNTNEIYTNNIHIEPTRIKFSEIKNHLNPDPYLAGILLFYGDYENNFISLPLDITRGIDYILSNSNYWIDCFDVKSDNRKFLKWKCEYNNKILWKDLFKHYNFYAKTKNSKDPLIPYEYQYTSIKNRIKFIRGIFDVGSNITLMPASNSICNKDIRVLECIQKILWSLGILSSIEYIPSYRVFINQDEYEEYENDQYYVLYVNSSDLGYPGFYYEIDYIAKMIKNNVNTVFNLSKSSINIKKIKAIGPGWLDNIKFKNIRKAIYTSGNYLPRVSL